MRRHLAVTTTVLALLLPACAGGDGGTTEERREEAASALEDVPLREDEAPDGLERSDRGTGPIRSLREILPPRSAFPNLPPVPAAVTRGFRGGYQVVYSRSSGEGGPSSAASSAIRFSEEGAASAFVAYLRQVQVGAGRGPERMEVPAAGLGEEGFGWHLEEPLSESSTVVWRSGDLVLTVSLGGPIGSASPELALALARRMEGRSPDSSS